MVVGERWRKKSASGSGRSGAAVIKAKVASWQLPAVPNKIHNQVREGKFVDFDCLLSCLDGSQIQKGYRVALSSHTHDGTAVVQYSPKVDSKFKVTDLPTWLRVWTVFLELNLYLHPHLTERLIRYQGIILRYFRTFKNRAWITYDSLFRQKISLNDSLQWDHEDTRLYNEVLKGQGREKSVDRVLYRDTTSNICYSCGKVGHMAKFCRNQKGTLADTRSSCFRWNAASGCVDASCKFPHICCVCGGGHPAVTCTTRAKR